MVRAFQPAHAMKILTPDNDRIRPVFKSEAPCEAAAGRAVLNVPPSVIDNPRTVLYIEDNCANALLLQGVLSYRPSIRLLAAQNGREGLSLAQEHAPDLILLDFHLPDMHGDQVLSCLHHHPRTAHSAVVMISVDAIGGEIDRLMELGASAYITKPYDVGHLLDVLDNALSVGAPNAVPEF